MQRSPLLDLHAAAGAVIAAADGPAPLLLTYGDVPGEHEAARRGAALFDETTRGLVRVHGADARELLHRLLANEVLPLEPGRGNRNLLLSPKGKVRFDFQLTVAPDGAYLLDTEPDDGARLRDALDMYVFSEAVELEDLGDEAAPLLLVGPAAADAARAATGLEPPDEVGACAFASSTAARCA
ncbi:MAG: hypothetical protein H6828_01575 [Planctomycetes bacterium]|nr:hypothetical protein [Planctomycetota bacterium]